MLTTTAAWLMATLTPSALMVALVQTASTAPALPFGLAAGALADIVDRRRIILSTHVTLVVVAAVLGIAELFGYIGPAALLAGTFAIGAAFAFYLPAQGASVNDLVGRSELPTAVSLGAVAFNVARALGPALAGAIAAAAGSGSALIIGAVFFATMIYAVYPLTGLRRPIPGVPETLFSGIQSGLRYARHSAALRALITRNLSFSLCASALGADAPRGARPPVTGRGRLRYAARRLRRRRDHGRARDPAADETALAQRHRHVRRDPVGGGGDAVPQRLRCCRSR